jgi:hypothetical protein
LDPVLTRAACQMAGILGCATKRYARSSEIDGNNVTDDGLSVQLDYRRLVWCRAKPTQIGGQPVVPSDACRPRRARVLFHSSISPFSPPGPGLHVPVAHSSLNNVLYTTLRTRKILWKYPIIRPPEEQILCTSINFNPVSRQSLEAGATVAMCEV